MGHGAWEYMILNELERHRLPELGGVGWELAGVGGCETERVLYLKRRELDFRERVTLNQRRRYFESLGLDPRERTNSPGA